MQIWLLYMLLKTLQRPPIGWNQSISVTDDILWYGWSLTTTTLVSFPTQNAKIYLYQFSFLNFPSVSFLPATAHPIQLFLPWISSFLFLFQFPVIWRILINPTKSSSNINSSGNTAWHLPQKCWLLHSSSVYRTLSQHYLIMWSCGYVIANLYLPCFVTGS